MIENDRKGVLYRKPRTFFKPPVCCDELICLIGGTGDSMQQQQQLPLRSLIGEGSRDFLGPSHLSFQFFKTLDLRQNSQTFELSKSRLKS